MTTPFYKSDHPHPEVLMLYKMEGRFTTSNCHCRHSPFREACPRHRSCSLHKYCWHTIIHDISIIFHVAQLLNTVFIFFVLQQLYQWLHKLLIALPFLCHCSSVLFCVVINTLFQAYRKCPTAKDRKTDGCRRMETGHIYMYVLLSPMM